MKPEPAQRDALAVARAPRASAIVALAALLAFAPTLRAGLVYDDAILIANNPALHRAATLWTAFTSHFFQGVGVEAEGLTYYRPLVIVSLVSDGLVFGGAAWGYHLVNLLLHAACAWLVTRLALRWTERPWLAVALGVLFAVHPTRTQSVAWIVGRTDILMSLFGLLAVEALHQLRETGRGRMAWIGLGSFVAALSCKETAVALPALLCADAWRDEPGGLTRSTRRYLLAAAGLALAYLSLRFAVFPVRTAASAWLPSFGFMTVATYVERLLWPWPQTFFYRTLLSGPDGPHYPTGLVSAGAALSLGYAVLVWRSFLRDRAAGACLLSAALFLSPVLNFFESGISFTVCDHYLYLPLFLLLLGSARAFREQLHRVPDKVLRWGALGFALLCLVPNTARARDFRSEHALWTRELALDPDNPVALSSLAVQEAGAGRLDHALRLLERAEAPPAQRRLQLAAQGRRGRRLQRLTLTAATTPDGDATTLGLLYEEIESFYTGKWTGRSARVGSLELGVEQGQAAYARNITARGRGALAAELATLATRLGRFSDAQRWLRVVDVEHPDLLPNPLNLVMVQARLGEYPLAFETLQRLDRLPSPPPGLDHAALERLARRLLRSQEHWIASRHAPEPQAAMLRALAALELGNYLVACRELRPAYLANREHGELAQLLTQALVSAGLDTEAEQIVARTLGPEEAARVVSRLRDQLPRGDRRPARTRP